MTDTAPPSDYYSHLLSIWDTEESLRERARSLFLALQGALLAAATIFFQSNRGLFLYFAFLFAFLAFEWFKVTTARARRLAFVIWAVTKFEKEGFIVEGVMSCLRALTAKLEYGDISLLKDETFPSIFHEYRSADFFVLGGTIFLWCLLASIAYSSLSEVELFGSWILELVGAK